MEITTASVAALVPIFQLLGKIIEYLTELQKNSKRHTQVIAELNGAVTRLKKTVEEEIEARKKEEERSVADRALTRKLIYGAATLACSPWIYIALHLAGIVR
jgi:hypothetical protein